MVYRRFHTRIEQFDNQAQKRSRQQHHLRRRPEAQHEGQHHQRHIEPQKLAEALLFAGGFETVERIAPGVNDAAQAGFAFDLCGVAVVVVFFPGFSLLLKNGFGNRMQAV